jgi:AraC family transcriptional regulator
MNPVQKAVWFVESHFASDISLDDVAAIAGLSRHHMVRAFAAATGRSVMRYVRARRLSAAARALADGAPDILAVALDAGYGSHEAFTRAFRDQFGITPEALRARRHLDDIDLVEPIRMDETLIADLEPPRFVDGKPLLIAGVGERYNDESVAAIPALWQRFHQQRDAIPRQVGRAAYGVCYNCDDHGNLDYLAGVEVADFSDLPSEFARLRIPARRYAVFSHREHVSTVRRTWKTIVTVWLPQSGYEMADAPDFERYGEAFDAETGEGGFEIWVPLKDPG